MEAGEGYGGDEAMLPFTDSEEEEKERKKVGMEAEIAREKCVFAFCHHKFTSGLPELVARSRLHVSIF